METTEKEKDSRNSSNNNSEPSDNADPSPHRKRRKKNPIDYTNLKYYCTSHDCKLKNSGENKHVENGGKNHVCPDCKSRLKEQCSECFELFSKGKGLTQHKARNCMPVKTLIIVSFGESIHF